MDGEEMRDLDAIILCLRNYKNTANPGKGKEPYIFQREKVIKAKNWQRSWKNERSLSEKQVENVSLDFFAGEHRDAVG